MKRLVFAVVAAALVVTATMSSVGAKGGPAEGGRAHGIAIANERNGRPETAGKVTFSDLLISGKPIDTGGSN